MNARSGYKLLTPADFYPTPERRKEDAVDTTFHVGDLVRALVGPAVGRIGCVVVDRNGNYEDYEPYASEDSIGVRFAEREELDPLLRTIAEGLIDHEATGVTVTRWFDGPKQLEFAGSIRKPSEE